jgi:hypothetical protein
VLNRNTDDDDLDIKNQLKKLFTEKATRGTDKIHLAEKEQSTTISVNITYEIIDTKIEARVTLKKNKVILKQFKSEGKLLDIGIFVKVISEEILKSIKF